MAKRKPNNILYVDIVLDDPERTTWRIDYKHDRVFEIKQFLLEVIPSVSKPVTLEDFTQVLQKAQRARAEGFAHPVTHPVPGRDPDEHERPDPSTF